MPAYLTLVYPWHCEHSEGRHARLKDCRPQANSSRHGTAATCRGRDLCRAEVYLVSKASLRVVRDNHAPSPVEHSSETHVRERARESIGWREHLRFKRTHFLRWGQWSKGIRRSIVPAGKTLSNCKRCARRVLYYAMMHNDMSFGRRKRTFGMG